ncbi:MULTISPECIES: hypothetical protein [unclassified Micromonospora]|uniref:hypothetical protein n=1 Tax=Micromonospora TaxID=1873 RepID=UPI0010759B44|nr:MULTISPECIES: hypothetical protein [unclassified Micromonospora]MBF5031083.1 hypothetical protein [Micromonospora sp. ANENR4]MCZ7474454.1 hypothetical protein [Micromonospora sp. WMMC273]WBC05101.1 hypothetical protein O7546_09090 [Micromonospora sp. WMMA1976]
MPPAVSRLLRWAAVIGLGIALTLAVWQDPVLAHGPVRPAPAAPGPTVALTVLALSAMLLTARRRPPRGSRRPAPVRPLSVPRSPGTRRSRR